MDWHEAVDDLAPHMVQITTPQGSGTGFFLYRAANAQLCAIATAAHVIDHVHYWEQPLRLRSVGTGRIALLRPADRAILVDSKQDTAVVLFDAAELQFPDIPKALIDEGYMQKVGVTIGWLGFPAIPGADLCFFAGTISSWLQEHKVYFVDGVVINGVSGGPAFSCYGEPQIIGVVSAYMPNRATGETLPGLSIIRDVTHLHTVVKNIRSLEEAKAKESDPAERPAESAAPPPALDE